MDTCVSHAIIMRIREFGESDLLISFFTPDRGRLMGVARGGRRSRKRFANCLDLFCLARLEYGSKPKGDLFPLNSCKLIHAFAGIRTDFSALSLAGYMVELAEILFPQNVVDKGMFDLLNHSFLALSEGVKRNDVLRIVFETKAMSLGGYGINFERCCSCKRSYTGAGRAVFMRSKGGIACLNCEQESGHRPGMGSDAVMAVSRMQSDPLNGIIEGLDLSEETIREIKPVMKLHIEYRIGQRLKSAKYLE